MSCEKIFLGWEKAFLPNVASFLIASYRKDDLVDLKDLVLVTPGSRAGRRLLELLVFQCEATNLSFVPPRIVTVGSLPQVILSGERPLVNDSVGLFAWHAALHRSSRENLEVVFSHIPEVDSGGDWLMYADQIRRLHRELNSYDLHFEDVANACRTMPDYIDDARWQALSQIEQDYYAILKECGYEDIGQHVNNAILSSKIDCNSTIFLVAAYDIPELIKKMVRVLPCSVVSLVFAPEQQSSMFDDLGCLDVKAWGKAQVIVSDELLFFEDAPLDQVMRTGVLLKGSEQKQHCQNITIGTCSDELIPILSRTLEPHGVVVRRAEGISILQAGPIQCLQLVRDFAITHSYESFAALIRHCDIECWLESKLEQSPLGLPAELDNYQTEHLQALLEQKIPHASNFSLLARAVEQVCAVCSKLSSTTKPFSQWGQVIADVVSEIYQGSELSRNNESDRQTIEACEALQTVLLEIDSLDSRILPEISGVEAIRIVLSSLQKKFIANLPNAAAIETLGWLELALDDAPMLVVLGCNEGSIPESVNSDAFLPNALRSKLGIMNNERRFARDLYVLQTMIESKEQLAIIAGRYSINSEPLMLSRILLACSSDRQAQLVQRFLEEKTTKVNRVQLIADRSKELQKFRPELCPNLFESLHISQFRDYLNCPYRFYLRHVLKLKDSNDRVYEMDARQFGTLAHSVLQGFGQSKFRESRDEKEIEQFLHGQLDKEYEERFGENAYPITKAQIVSLKERLSSFAQWQSDWRNKGWKIAYCEQVYRPGEVSIEVEPGRSFGIHGRIDRIDYNEHEKKWLILDYKTGEAGASPERTHKKQGEWKDLQLPLYRYLYQGKSGSDGVEVGYLNLAAALDKVGCVIAKWGEEDFISAYEVARLVCKNVMEGRYWPPARGPIAFDEYSRLMTSLGMEGLEDVTEDEYV